MSQTAQPAQAKDNPGEHAADMKAEPTREHQWLQQLVGDWTYETEVGGTKATGVERGRSIGGLWVQLEGNGDLPGTQDKAITLQTLGYDPAKKRFVGSWVGSMMTHQWVYDGELDEARNALLLQSEGPSMNDPNALALYRDTIALEGSDRRTLTAAVRKEDGSWESFMTVTYLRKKA